MDLQKVVADLQNQDPNFMRRETFLARIDEFSFDNRKLRRASKLVLGALRAKNWQQVPELKLGKAFKLLQCFMGNEKALKFGDHRAFREVN